MLAVVALLVVAFIVIAVVRDRARVREDPTQDRAPGPSAGPQAVLFDFDAGLQSGAQGMYVIDSTAGQLGYERTSDGGSVTVIEHAGSGKAVKFPDRCPAGQACPSAVIDVADADFLNPGTRPFVYGADLLVRPEDSNPGVNVIHKGLGQPGGSQWKLELGAGGTVRCVLVPAATGTVFRAESGVGVADGSWHSVRCIKSADALSVEVDGAVADSVALPARLAVDSPGVPLRLGGRSVESERERFSGAVDNVSYRLA